MIAYYGAKHGLASKYPRPRHPVIVEPFAGSAGYSCYWVAHVDRVILIDADPEVVKLWDRLLGMTSSDLDAIDQELREAERTTDPILGGIAGSSTLHATLSGKDRQITPRMHTGWPQVRARIERTLPHAYKFDVSHGHYTDAPDMEATWHIDPPYKVERDDYRAATDWSAGNAYRYSAAEIDYPMLGRWCQGRRGFVMVCEQSPANWLPFTDLTQQVNGSNSGQSHTELIWRNDQQQERLF